MKTRKLHYSFEDDLKISLKNKAFKKAWDESEPEYMLAKQMVEARLKMNLSQRDLARKVHTSQAAICRVETGRGNPSFCFLKRLTAALGGRLQISI